MAKDRVFVVKCVCATKHKVISDEYNATNAQRRMTERSV